MAAASDIADMLEISICPALANVKAAMALYRFAWGASFRISRVMRNIIVAASALAIMLIACAAIGVGIRSESIATSAG